jgi:hypothetical protein
MNSGLKQGYFFKKRLRLDEKLPHRPAGVGPGKANVFPSKFFEESSHPSYVRG